MQHLRLWVGERVAFEPYQTAHVRFPAIPLGAFREAVHLVEPDGRVSRGAEAFFRALAHGGQALPLAVYRGLPGVAALSEWGYRQVAAHQIPDPGQHRTLFYGEYSNRAGGTREPVAVGEITELTPRLAKTYAGISAKTLQRDLAAVEEMELVERKPEGVRARRELILAFLPWRRTTAQPKAGT